MTSRFVLPLADVGAGITPSSGAQLFFYETGTTTPKDTYSDAAGTTPNANPVVANSVGVFPDIFISGTYKVVLKNTDGVQQWAADPVTSDDSVYVSKTELAAAGGSGLVGHTQSGNDYTLAAYLQTRHIEWPVVVADNATDNTSVIQASIDYVNASYLAGTFGGLAGIVMLPAGLIKYSGLILKKGVSLIGQGQGNTVLLLDTDGATGIKTPAKASQLAADAVSQSVIKGITFGIHSSLTPTVSTVLLDTSGMTRCTFDDLSFVVPSNVIGCDNTGNTLAGSGGAAHWYNVWIKPFFDVSGGIGIRWGENDSGTGEQVTKQDFFGGRIGGTSGTGIHIRGGTGISFFGTTFEGLDSGADNTIILGDTSGARTTTSVNMIGHYFEQVKITYNTNTNRCMRLNGLEVNVTEVNNGTRCGRIDYDQFYHGWTRTYASARVTTPTTINKGYNMASITRVGLGIFDCTFTDALSSTNYIAIAQAESDDAIPRISTKTTAAVRVVFENRAGTAVDPTSFVLKVEDTPT